MLRLLAPVAVIGALVVASPGAHAQSAQSASGDQLRARQLFEHGVADYEAGRYAQALASFQEAFRLKPHPMVRVNMANCYDKLGQPLQAIFHFEGFLEAKQGTATQRREVTKALRRLRRKVAPVTFRVAPDGAVITIDGGEQRRAPIMEPVLLEQGYHRVEVRLDGYAAQERQFEVLGGKPSELDVTLARGPSAGPPVLSVTPTPASASAASLPPDSAPAPQSPPPSQAYPEAVPTVAADPPPAVPYAEPVEPTDHTGKAGIWTTGAISVGLLLTGTFTGALALDADSEFDKLQRAYENEASGADRVRLYNEARDAADRARGLALTTDVLLLGSAVSGAIAIYLLATRGDETDSSTGRIDVGPRGLTLVRRF